MRHEERLEKRRACSRLLRAQQIKRDREVVLLWGIVIPRDGKRNPLKEKARIVYAPYGAIMEARKLGLCGSLIRICGSGDAGKESAEEALENLRMGFETVAKMMDDAEYVRH